MIPVKSAGRIAFHGRIFHFRTVKRKKVTTSSQQTAAQIPSPSPSTQTATTTTIPDPSWLWLQPFTAPFRAYGRAQARRPYVTQFLSSLTIYFVGDLAAQSIQHSTPESEQGNYETPSYSPAQTMRALLIGGISSIPSYKWFMFLGRSFNYTSQTLSLFTKVVVNQVIFAPLFNSYFFGMQAALSGQSATEIVEHIKRTVPISWINSCKLWPAVTAFSFAVVPAEYRSIFAGVIAIGWQTYLSLLHQRAHKVEESEHSTSSNLAYHRHESMTHTQVAV